MTSENWYKVMLLVEEYEDEHRPHLFANEDDLHGFTSYDLEQGSAINGWDADSWLRSARLEYEDGPAYDMLASSLHLPIFSLRLQRALDRSGCAVKDLQYLPINVFKSTGEQVRGFAIANVITRIKALDHDNCFLLELDDEIDPLTGTNHVHSVGRFALRAAPLAGHDIIRLVEFWPPVFVSERFKRVFDEGGFTGATFSPVRVS